MSLAEGPRWRARGREARVQPEMHSGFRFQLRVAAR